MRQDTDPDGAHAPESARTPAQEDSSASEPLSDDAEADLSAQPEARAQLRQTHYRYVGPLPEPGHLQQYDDILPGAAERIFASWEAQSHHRQRLEIRSQWCALTTVLAAIGAGVLCAAFGQPWVGGAIAVTAVLGVTATSILRLFPGSR